MIYQDILDIPIARNTFECLYVMADHMGISKEELATFLVEAALRGTPHEELRAIGFTLEGLSAPRLRMVQQLLHPCFSEPGARGHAVQVSLN